MNDNLGLQPFLLITFVMLELLMDVDILAHVFEFIDELHCTRQDGETVGPKH